MITVVSLIRLTYWIELTRRWCPLSTSSRFLWDMLAPFTSSTLEWSGNKSLLSVRANLNLATNTSAQSARSNSKAWTTSNITWRCSTTARRMCGVLSIPSVSVTTATFSNAPNNLRRLWDIRSSWAETKTMKADLFPHHNSSNGKRSRFRTIRWLSLLPLRHQIDSTKCLNLKKIS